MTFLVTITSTKFYAKTIIQFKKPIFHQASVTENECIFANERNVKQSIYQYHTCLCHLDLLCHLRDFPSSSGQ